MFSNVIGCSSVEKLSLPMHGGTNESLYIITDSLLLSSADPPPPHGTLFEVGPKVQFRQAPQYPPLEVVFQKEADVDVKVWVNKEGQVVQAIVFRSSDDLFNKAAAEAAMKWRFSPAIVDGDFASVWVKIPFRFRIERGCRV